MARRPANSHQEATKTALWEWASTQKPPTDKVAFEYGPTPICLSGGFGCIAAGTEILGADGSLNRVEDLVASNTAIRVVSWDGATFVEAQASVPWLKGEDELYRITTAAGRFIVVTEHHKFLSDDGWSSLSSGLRLGSRLRGYDVYHSQSILVDYLSWPHVDDLRLSQTPEGFPVYSLWDYITQIEPVGRGLFYDLEVPVHHNYVAHGLIHHNSGKTIALCRKALWMSSTFPNNRGVIARKQWTTLKDTTMSTFFKICPALAYNEKEGGKRSDSEKYLKLARSGSEILWLHLDDQDIDKIIRGLEINWFLLDQAEEIPEEVFATLLTRLGRWDKAEVPEWFMEDYGGAAAWPWKNPLGRPIVPTYAMIACNPDIEQHWIWRRFHEESPDWKERYKARGYKMLTMRSDENRFLPKQNLEEMLSADERLQRRFVRGEWGIPEGQIHRIDRDSPVIIKGTVEIAQFLFRTCSIYRSMDHGDASPTAVGWWAVDTDGNVFLVAEYYKPNLLISEHRANLKLMEQQIVSSLSLPELKYRGQYADPSIFFKTMQKYGGRFSVRDDYEDVNPSHGFKREDAIYWESADNDEMGTRNTINEYLKLQGPRIHPITKEKGMWPRLFFIQATPEWPMGCTETITQTRSQRRVRIGMEAGRPSFSDDRDDNVADHAYDLVRYFMASRSAKPATTQQTYSKNSFFGKRDEYLKFKRQGGWEKIRKEAMNA